MGGGLLKNRGRAASQAENGAISPAPDHRYDRPLFLHDIQRCDAANSGHNSPHINL
jgi:hypothetical protein